MIVQLWERLVKTRLDTNSSIISGDLSPAIASLHSTIDSIREHWQGSDHDYFENNIKPFLNDLDELETSILSFHKYIQGYLDAYSALVSSYQSRSIDLK